MLVAIIKRITGEVPVDLFEEFQYTHIILLVIGDIIIFKSLGD